MIILIQKCDTSRPRFTDKTQNNKLLTYHEYLNIFQELLVVKIRKSLTNKCLKVQLQRLYQSTQLHRLVATPDVHKQSHSSVMTQLSDTVMKTVSYVSISHCKTSIIITALKNYNNMAVKVT